MKRLLTVILFAGFVVSIAACGSSSSADASTGGTADAKSMTADGPTGGGADAGPDAH